VVNERERVIMVLGHILNRCVGPNVVLLNDFAALGRPGAVFNKLQMLRSGVRDLRHSRITTCRTTNKLFHKHQAPVL
jgi:hypothetical protein